MILRRKIAIVPGIKKVISNSDFLYSFYSCYFLMQFKGFVVHTIVKFFIWMTTWTTWMRTIDLFLFCLIGNGSDLLIRQPAVISFVDVFKVDVVFEACWIPKGLGIAVDISTKNEWKEVCRSVLPLERRVEYMIALIHYWRLLGLA